jgi:general L-amino acid transport system permease protein
MTDFSWHRRPGFSWRSALAQAAFLLVIVFLLAEAFIIGRANMQAHNIPTDFAFLRKTSGFDINQTLVAYSAASSYARAFFVGLLNTLVVAVIGLALATLLGFTVGIARLSQNLAVAKLALLYVEIIRNVPLLLQLLFWYNAVLRPLPPPEHSLVLPGHVFLNNRGVVLPELVGGPALYWLIALCIGLFCVWRYAASEKRGHSKSAFWLAALLFTVCASIVALTVYAVIWKAPLVSVVMPVLGKYNFDQGWHIRPEFIALVLGLSVYTASFVAEIVRAGIASVPVGLKEAGSALGLKSGQTLRLIVIPLAFRVIIPPLTSQYVNLVKNSSLAVFIGYPDLVQVFAGTVLNQTGAAVQVMGMTMAVYLVLSLAIAAVMNLYNRHITRFERSR